MKNYLLVLLLSLPLTVLGNTNYFCQNALDDIPIQQGGRVMPLYVHAKESIKFLTGKSSVGKVSAVEAYCLLSIKGFGLPQSFEIQAPIEHEKLKDFLKLPDRHPKISFDQLVLKKRDLIRQYQMEKEESSYKKALNKALNRVKIYQDIAAGTNWTLAKPIDNKVSWQPFVNFFDAQAVMAQVGAARSEYLYREIVKSRDYYAPINGTFLLELKYAKAHLIGWALLFTLLALGAKVLFKNPKISLGFTIINIVILTVFIILRVLISGRAPVTNMYETVMFSGYGALLIGMIVGHFKKEFIFVMIALAYNVLTLMMLIFADGMLNAHISPLVPVLRDNFWLSTHVSCIIISYGALALSWILANGIIIRKTFFSISKQDENYYSELIYTCLKIGTTLLAAGIILGGVWADYSWGRFWGWDPKETWSLIVLCIYIAILHGRYTSWIPNKRFIQLVAAAFMSVMMAWFGVNYILATGLHSYGFSQGGAVFLFSFFAIQIAIIFVGSNFGKKKKIG